MAPQPAPTPSGRATAVKAARRPPSWGTSDWDTFRRHPRRFLKLAWYFIVPAVVLSLRRDLAAALAARTHEYCLDHQSLLGGEHSAVLPRHRLDSGRDEARYDGTGPRAAYDCINPDSTPRPDTWLGGAGRHGGLPGPKGS